ncbi:ASCH domain-containing protein [Cronobacter dublinensis]
MKALSIRQPWAWLIANGYKDIENRSWNTKYRGPILIHASSRKPSKNDCDTARMILKNTIGIDAALSMPKSFDLGGIVGVATISDCVDNSPSTWFFGPKGFVLNDAQPLPFYPMKGKLSFFETGLTPEDLKGGAA